MRRGEEEFPCLFKLGKNALRFSASRPEEEGENGNPNKVDIRRLPPFPPLNCRLSKTGVCAITKKAMGGRNGRPVDATNSGGYEESGDDE